MASAGAIWGLSPLLYKYIDHIPALEVASHRVVWSSVIFTSLLVVRGKLGQVASLVRSRRQFAIGMLAAALVSVNWLLFVYAIQIGKTTEASLGYFLFPLATVFLGWMVLGERFSPMQWVAVGIAVLSVAILTLGLGVAPWISIALASTFGVYGICKVRMAAGPTVSVTFEVLIVTPLALLWIVGAEYFGWTGVAGGVGGHFGEDALHTSVLVFSGVVTAGPLILMAYAAKRLRYSDGGLILYTNPTLQFLVAVLIFRELFTVWHAVAFPMIWVALCVYSVESLRRSRAFRNSSTSAATDSWTEK